MNELIYVPQDHRNIIYTFLDVASLIRLGSTCKYLNVERGRIFYLMQKVVDSYFYIHRDDVGVIKNWMNFPYENLFYEIYLERLKKISVKDIQIVNIPNVQSIIVHHQLREIKTDDNFYLHITFFTGYIIGLPRPEKHEVLKKVFEYLFSLKKMDKLEFMYLNILFEDIYKSLCHIFKDERDVETRMFMIQQIEDKDRPKFLTWLPLDYNDIVSVIEIASLDLESSLIEYFLDIYFEQFLDIDNEKYMTNDGHLGYIDYYVDDMYYQLKMKYKSRLCSYGDILKEKYGEEKYNTLLKVIDIRRKRCMKNK